MEATVTKEEVLNAEKIYKKLLSKYLEETNTLVRMIPCEDDYRGDLSCLSFLDKNIKIKKISGDRAPDIQKVFKNGVEVGILKSWYGNNGRGKAAADAFIPLEGVKVVGKDELI